MDKFEKRLNQVSMVTPKNTGIQQSTIKQSDPTKSYASFNDFNKLGEQYDNEVVNLRSQVQILEGKLQFYEREFQIKQSSLEKRIQQLISTSSQLTQQNTQLRLQYSSLLNEYQSQQDKISQQEKGQKDYEEKVRQQLDGMSKFQTEKDQLISYANKCRERSKQRKIKVKELTSKVQEMQEQIKEFQQLLEESNQEKESIYSQCQEQIQMLTEQNEDWQMKYEQIVENFKNHLADQTESQQEEQLLANHTVLDQREAQTVQQQLENFSYLQKDLNTLLSQMRNANPLNPQSFQVQSIVELAEIFNRVIEKLYELQQKKSMLKEQIKELQSLQLQMHQASIKSSSGNQSPNLVDDRTKMLFEQRILELEQYYINNSRFYQKDKKQEKPRSITMPKGSNGKLHQVVNLLGQFVEEFIKQQESLRILNYQLNDMEHEPKEQNNNRTIKKIAWAVIAIYRMKKIKNTQYYQTHIVFNKLSIEMPIINSLNQMLELVSGQQQLIDTLQKAIEYRGSEEIPESEIQQMMDQELRQQLKTLQIELENNNKKMLEYKLKSEQDIEERDQIIKELEVQLNDAQNEYNQQLLEHLDEQNQRVKNIENEFNVLNELVNSLM